MAGRAQEGTTRHGELGSSIQPISLAERGGISHEEESKLQPWDPRPGEAEAELAGMPRREVPEVPQVSLAERSAFLFDLRPLEAPGPYLEQLATIHLPQQADGASEPWRKLVVQPAVIPDLQHTGIRSDFTYQGETFMRPDGQVTNELRNTVHQRFNAIPKTNAADPQDMQYVDMMRSIRRGGAFQNGAASVLGGGGLQNPSEPVPGGLDTGAENVRGEYEETSQSGLDTDLEESLASRERSKAGKSSKKGRRRSPRKKKPCSEKALLECLLDLEYGNSNPQGKGEGDQEFRWNISGFVDKLE